MVTQAAYCNGRLISPSSNAFTWKRDPGKLLNDLDHQDAPSESKHKPHHPLLADDQVSRSYSRFHKEYRIVYT